MDLEKLSNKDFAYSCINLLIENEAINSAEISLLTNGEQCAKRFCSSSGFPILIDVSGYADKEELGRLCCDKSNRQRYYTETISIFGRDYVITNHWYGPNKSMPDNRTPFMKWVLMKINGEKIQETEQEPNIIEENAENIYERIKSTLDEYLEAEISPSVARTRIMEQSLSDVMQEEFKKDVPLSNRLKSTEDIIFSYKYVGVNENKNTCEMKAVNLYEKRPNWKVKSHVLYYKATIVLTNQGVHFIEDSDYFVPYNKIEDVGFKEFETKRKKEKSYLFHFDIKTSSPYGRRVIFHRAPDILDINADDDPLFRATQIIGLMSKIYG